MQPAEHDLAVPYRGLHLPLQQGPAGVLSGLTTTVHRCCALVSIWNINLAVQPRSHPSEACTIVAAS